MTFWLGLLLSICSIPGITSAFIPTQWAVLSALLPLGLWRSGNFGPGHWLCLSTLAWAALSIIWSHNVPDALYGFWLLLIWAGAFWFGSTLSNLATLWNGIAVGLAASSAIAILQWFGFHPVLDTIGDPSGLFYNSTVLGAVSALTLIALNSNGIYRTMPLVIPSLLLSQSRAAWLIVFFVFIAQSNRRIALAIFIGVCAASALWPRPSDLQRMLIWGVTLHALIPFGHGIGSYTSFIFYNRADIYPHSLGLFQAGFAHNDYLQLAFELGIGATPIYALYLLCLRQTWHRDWPVFLGFASLSLFYFPLYHPLTAFIGCVCAGHLVHAWHHSRDTGWVWRHGYFLRSATS